MERKDGERGMEREKRGEGAEINGEGELGREGERRGTERGGEREEERDVDGGEGGVKEGEETGRATIFQ